MPNVQEVYTRIHKFGFRLGDNAPMAILELVDNPHDIKLEITARAVGWGTTEGKALSGDVSTILQEGVGGAEDLIMEELSFRSKGCWPAKPCNSLELAEGFEVQEPNPDWRHRKKG